MGRMIEFEGNGERYQGYLATPLAGQGPGLIVVQEYWGLVGHIKDVVERFAAEGFVTLAPDLYQGESTTEPDDAATMMMALNMPVVQAILGSAADALLAGPEVTSDECGVVGFCMGGQLALYAAAAEPTKFAACVNFYGIHPIVDPPLENLRGPVLGIFAEHDEYTPPTAVQALEYKFNKLGKPHKFITYPGTQHAFFNDQRPDVYDAEASADAWRRTVDFLKANLFAD
ncbi:MAG: dienelactone hydrolase family protein [Armatimonadota bacterium]|nr:dienelactone hydrolase family protein [Armatimonadota bacterium]